MHCSLCKASGHNKRTCPSAPTASEVRVAKKLSALLPPPRSPKAVSKPVEGLQGFAKFFKEPKEFFTPAKTTGKQSRGGSKQLEGLQDFAKFFKEPKEFFTPAKTTGKQSRLCSNCGNSGHNSRTCGKFSLMQTTKTLVGQRRCGICGENGHNSRTCQLKCKPCIDLGTA